MKLRRPSRTRLDDAMVDRGIVDSKPRGAALIMSGRVFVNGTVADKAGFKVAEEDTIKVVEPSKFVGRGAYKLEAALNRFKLQLSEKECADVGSSTGGFTEVLLQSGASKVYAIDVGYGELDWALRSDSRVVVLERTNARYLNELPSKVDFVCIDVSFISLKLLLPGVKRWLKYTNDLVILIKPQFEAKREEVPSNGVIEDSAIRHRVIVEILNFAVDEGFHVNGLIASPISGRKGNREYLAWLSTNKISSKSVEELITELNEFATINLS